MASIAQDRKRTRTEDSGPQDARRLTGATPVTYAPDDMAKGVDAFNASPGDLLWRIGGLDLEDPEDLPSADSIPQFSYRTRSRSAAAPASDVSKHAAVLEKFLRDEFKRKPSRESGMPAARLQASMVKTALFQDYELAARGDGTGGQGWTRKPETDYLLKGESKESMRPEGRTGNFRDEGAQQPAIPSFASALIKNIFIPHIKSKWPRHAVDQSRAEDLRHALVNGYIFFHAYLSEWLLARASQEVGQLEKTAGGSQDVNELKLQSPAYNLLVELRDKDPEHSLKRGVLQSVLDQLNGYSDHDGLGYALVESREFIAANQSMRKIGEIARDQALWIRCETISEEELKSFDKKVIAETHTIARVGIATGAFGKDDVIVVDNTWRRIERPSSDDPELRSFILWEPDGPEDFTPTMDKAVSGIIYNAPVLTDLTTEFQMNHDRDRHANAIEMLLSHQGVGRNVHDNHGTVKMPEGTHTINGQVQTQPFAAAIPKNIDEHASFRHLYTERRDVSQVWAFELMATFLPRFAREQMERCRQSGLLTRFGTPAYACFGSWGYFSSSHIDADDGATHADVTERGEQVKPDSSNFFLTKYKLIVELADKARWFWEANKSPHGTTLCYPSAAYPRKWKLFVRHEHLRATGQITSAFVTTQKANSAAARRL